MFGFCMCKLDVFILFAQFSTTMNKKVFKNFINIFIFNYSAYKKINQLITYIKFEN